MKTLLLLTLGFFSAIGFSQVESSVLDIVFPNNSHGALYALNEDIVNVVTDDGIFYRTTDGGLTWSDYDSGVDEDFFDMTFQDNLVGFAVGTNGSILKTTDGGQTWVSINSGTSEILTSIAVNIENSIWIGGSNGTLLHSIDGGINWQMNNSVTPETIHSIKFKDENIGYFAGNNGTLFYTLNTGTDWESINTGTNDDLFSISITDSYVHLLSGTAEDFFYRAEYRFLIYYTTQYVSYHMDGFLGEGVGGLFFKEDLVGYRISAEACLCDICTLQIDKTEDFFTWNPELSYNTNAANCIASAYFGKMVFASDEVTYLLYGKRIFKANGDFVNTDDFNKNNAFTIYPNPSTNGKFNLKINSTNTQGLSLEVIDIAGKKIYAENDLKENNTISLPNISEGIYFIKLLKDGKMVANQKLIEGN
ncbi:MAG: T9SS type A sorting domain-containing protein [Flavobacteriaceae bacterium]|nr:T9SS type A sorting domain-containing protein [Flavobacteriaceae bacterium]